MRAATNALAYAEVNKFSKFVGAAIVAVVVMTGTAWGQPTGTFNLSTGTWSTGDDITNRCSWNGTVLTVNNGANIEVVGSTGSRRIEVAGNAVASITLNNVSISSNSSSNRPPFNLNSGANATLTIIGINSLVSGSEAGIGVGSGRTLIIDGTGSLTARSNDNNGAGIGGGWGLSVSGTSGNIIINGGTITATGAGSGAGIGGGIAGGCGNIIINGGTVTARGGERGGAGIGGGAGVNVPSGNITINGGTVTAVGGNNRAAGIGAGSAIGSNKIFAMNGNAIVFASSLTGGSPLDLTTNTTNVTSGILVVGNTTHTFHPAAFTLSQNVTIPSGYRLTVGNGRSLTIPDGVTLTNNGTIIEDEFGEIVVDGTFNGNKITTSFAARSLSAIYGQTLEEVELPTSTKAGTFSWNLRNEQTPSDVSVGTVARPATGLSLIFSGEHYNPAQVAVNLTVNKAEAPAIVAFPTSATEITYGQTLAASKLEFESDDNGTFAWTNRNTVPTVAQSGTAFEVTYTPNDAANYDYSNVTLTSMVMVTVNKADQMPMLAVAEVAGKKYGDNPFVLEATGGSGTGVVTYELVSGTAAAVTSAGLVTIVGVGDIVVRAIKVGDDNYNSVVSANRTITIGKADQSALVVSAVTGKKYGDDPFELEVMGGSGTGIVTYERVSGTAAAVTSAGLVTIVGVGDIVVRAIKAGDDNYNSVVSENVTITITAAISIASPDRIIPPPTDLDTGASVIAPVVVTSGEFTAGPNPVDRQSGSVNFYWTGRALSRGTLFVYDASGNVVTRIAITDNASNGQARRQIGTWNLTDRRGRPVSDGTYLIRGVLTTVDGTRERVSTMIGVR